MRVRAVDSNSGPANNEVPVAEANIIDAYILWYKNRQHLRMQYQFAEQIQQCFFG